MSYSLKVGLAALGLWALVIGGCSAAFATATTISNPVVAALLDSSVAEMMYNGERHCSAAKISPTTFLTAGHCVRQLGDYKINGQPVISVHTGLRDEDDWAIVHVEKPIEGMSTLSFGCSVEPYLGMPVASFGYPGGTVGMFSVGYVSALSTHDTDPVADILADLEAGPGASGSPVISMETGQIIGILIGGVVSQGSGRVATRIEGISSFCATGTS